MAKNIAELIVDRLVSIGVTRIYGIVGDSLNGITDALRRNGRIEWVHVRHEEAAAFAAGAEAHLTGAIAVCAGSCGPGNLHLINGLFDCHRNRVPVLAIAAHIPTAEIGSGYFQETHPEHLFRECSHYCELLSSPSQTPWMIDIAIQHAIGRRGVSVLVISGDTALQAAPNPAAKPALPAPRPIIRPSDEELDRLVELLDGARRVTLLCGSGCAGAHDEVVRLAETLKAPIVHAMRGKEFIEYDNPYDVGMTGLLGFSSGYYAMLACDVLVMLGTDFPYRQFYPDDAKVVQIDVRAEHLGRRVPLTQGLVGDVKATLDVLSPRLRARGDRTHLDKALTHYRDARRGLDDLATPGGRGRIIHPQYVARLVSEQASADAIFTCDVGTPTIWAARYLQMNGHRRLLGSFSHGSMANALPQAIGAQAAYPTRQVIALSGDGGLAMLMGELATLTQEALPVKVIVFNNSTLGFVELEQKAAGYLATGVELKNPDFAKVAEASGLLGVRVDDPGALPDALARVLAHKGPALLDVVVNRQELAMPPKVTSGMALGFGLYMVRAILNGRGDEVVELARTNLLR